MGGGTTGNNAISVAIPNGDNTVTLHTNNNETTHHQHQPKPPKQSSWVGTMIGGVTALTVTTAVVAGYVVLNVRKQPNSSNLHSMTTTVSNFERFSLDWWRHRLATIISPTVIPSAEVMQLQLQQHQQQEAAVAAASAATANIVNTSVQTAIEQFQKELQTQLIHDRNQSTIQFLNTMQSQERTLTQTLGQPIHSTKQQMSVLQQQIQTLQQIFMSPKSRGTFGEVQLELLIKDVLPATMYTMQYTLSNKKRVDCMLHLPSPIGNISIDSKFPTLTTNAITSTAGSAAATASATTSMGTSTLEESSAAITQPSSSVSSNQQEQQNARRKEIRDKLQKHINDIASKYIIPGETSPHAICFIPSASLFLDIVTDHSDILLYAHRQNVWLTCPTTLLAVLTSIQGISRGQVVAQQTTNIFALITKLNKDIDLLVNRFEMAEKSVERTRTELAKMQTSVHKIQKVKMELDALSQLVSSPVITKSSSQLSRKRSSDDPPDLSNDMDDNNNNSTMEAWDTKPQATVETIHTDAADLGMECNTTDSFREEEIPLNGVHETMNQNSITILGFKAPRISN
jgi:DNA recombination protein RmuC